ncbi:hypothetical protein D9757_007076 [Collybiopsis confluens]|uniref:Uncharacterized protein n=1 Tax=Collybiopsis confluens TaxID=2823264 RepID=A0A8H5HCJ3_9AGAR|nr:hypothetical protein D9757_007076 [Collybiopsis confluens]
MSVSCLPTSSPQLLSARLQTKDTPFRESQWSAKTGQVLPSLSSGGFSKRTRTASISSIDTIRVTPGKKKPASKKRARADDSFSHVEFHQTSQRRIRHRKDSLETAQGSANSVIAFPVVPDDAPDRHAPYNENSPRNGKKKGMERKFAPSGHCAPLVALTADNQAANSPSKLHIPPPTAIRQAPPPPLISYTVRSRLQSMKRPLPRPSSPSHHVTNPSSYRCSGFEPLPDHLQDWQPSSAPNFFSDDEYGVGTPSSPGTEWRDRCGHISPGISDLDLTIAFHKKQPFFDVWDLPDNIHIAVPATLHLTLKNPREWNEISSEPDLRYIDIKASTFDYRPLSEYFPPEYTVAYNGASSIEYADPSIVPADLTRGIIVNKKWHSSGSRSRFRESLITNYGRLPDDSIGADQEDVSQKRGWFFKFMIPIPSWVLRQGNTRAFTVEASAWAGGLDDGGLIRGDTELVISHLRSEREMVKGR